MAWMKPNSSRSDNNGLNETKQLKKLPMFLDREANNRFDNLSTTENNSLAELMSAFTTQLEPTTGARELHIEELSAAKLKPAETSEQFVGRVCKIVNEPSRTEADIRDHDLVGLPLPELKKKSSG